jgi:hypothetical protein
MSKHTSTNRFPETAIVEVGKYRETLEAFVFDSPEKYIIMTSIEQRRYES